MATKPHEKQLPVPRPAGGIRATYGPDGGTVLDITGNRIFRLNEMGGLILHCLQEGWNEARIATHISHQYSVSQGLAEHDVHEFLKVLGEHRLLDGAAQPEER